MSSTTVSRRFPSWLLRLVGYSSLAAAIVSLALYWYRHYGSKRRPPPRAEGGGSSLRRTDSSLNEAQQQQPRSSPGPAKPANNGWGARLLGGVVGGSSKVKRKRITVSLKNVVFWNPSSDVNSPNHAFHENAAAVMDALAKVHELYLIVHLNSEEEQQQVTHLLEKSGLLASVDSRKILYCSTEEGKIHMIRHIEPHIHVEGGWELDDGEDIVRKLRPFVQKVIWVITRRRRSSFNQAKLKASDQGILASNVELAEKLVETSLAREAGFVVAEDEQS